MATVIHTCSSILVRPNGIVRYINAVLDLQKSMGYKTIFVTDARPTQTIRADTVLYLNDVSTYRPNMRDGHVWLQPDDAIIKQMHKLYEQYSLMADLVVAHDLHSYYAAADFYANGVFVQHESDVLTPGSRYSFLDDDYLHLQKSVVQNTAWRTGLTVPSTHITPRRPVYTPSPFTVMGEVKKEKTRGLLYIGDATERKGAREFMAMARVLGETPTVITHEPDAEIFAGADVHTFALSQQPEMYELMSEHRVAYIPSRNECPGLAVLECLQFMPVVLDSQHAWTQYHKHTGALLRDGAMIQRTLANHLVNDIAYDRSRLDAYSANTVQLWTNLST
jgi:hypothetical protein